LTSHPFSHASIIFACRYIKDSTCSIPLLVEPLAAQNFRLNPKRAVSFVMAKEILPNLFKNLAGVLGLYGKYKYYK